MLIRYEAAITQVPFVAEEDRWALLADVLDPRAELLRISLAAAEHRGVKQMAYRLLSKTKRTSMTPA